MVERELKDLIAQVRERGCEWQTMEVKRAQFGCPERLYDTLSSFSNQDSGGVFLFGLDEKDDFKKTGAYDAQDLQKKIVEYCEQMTPVVRPVFTVYDENGMVFVSAEIPPVDVADRPCFKTAMGRLKGSFIRVGDADKQMSEYEVYSYEAYRKKYRDDIRTVELATEEDLDTEKIDAYLNKKRSARSNLAALSRERQMTMAGILREGKITISAILLFGVYPQASFPQLSIIATCVPGTAMGELDPAGNRFTDSKRIEGTLPEMLDGALAFVRTNMRVATRIDPKTGERSDQPQYPMDAVREAVLNALVHRDYSFHTEGKPIQLLMFSDRMEIINPGGLYGRLTLDQLGQAQPDTRNPVLVTAMELLGETENRYSGIPTIRAAMKAHSLPAPVFQNRQGTFTVVLYNGHNQADAVPETTEPAALHTVTAADPKHLLDFCQQPRSRAEILAHIGITSEQYAIATYLLPLVEAGLIRRTIPDRPRSRKQQYVTVIPD